jgi:hypothetical protein
MDRTSVVYNRESSLLKLKKQWENKRKKRAHGYLCNRNRLNNYCTLSNIIRIIYALLYLPYLVTPKAINENQDTHYAFSCHCC